MERLPIAVPSLAEQAEIVRRVDELFALADQLEANYLAAVERVKKLTPAVLAKAFRGELVAQDPSDEPAEKLLERIRAQREAEGPAGLAGQGRGRRAGSGGRGRGGVKTGAPGKKRGRRPRAS
jgi:type I restriction enzyme S subunit